MTPEAVTFLLVVLFPLLVGSWRVSLLGLALQGLLLGWMAQTQLRELSASELLPIADALLLRGIAAPAVLYRILERQGTPSRNEVIPPNLFVWALAGVLVLIAFRFSELPGLNLPNDRRAILGVAAAALLIGIFVVATRDSAINQMIGLLRIDNAIMLFELGAPRRTPLALEAGLSAVYVLTLATFSLYLNRIARLTAAPAEDEGHAL
ncbi:MAG: hypothetical protein JST54_01895 [Deltaproteobacteria bacterium]|nr:hypothetical protein [Deltaproteobacteria bacterium]